MHQGTGSTPLCKGKYFLNKRKRIRRCLSVVRLLLSSCRFSETVALHTNECPFASLSMSSENFHQQSNQRIQAQYLSKTINQCLGSPSFTSVFARLWNQSEKAVE